MSDRLYLRKVRLTASSSGGGSAVINRSNIVEKHEIKIAFDVKKSLSSTQNPATIRLFNIAPDLRQALGKELDTITLEAGYMPPEGGGNVGIIFKGQIRDVEHTRQGNDIITRISNGEGDAAVRRATISKTYPAGTKVEDVMEDIYKEMEKEGVKKGQWNFPENVPPFRRPYSVCGSCKREADTIGRSNGFYWSVQNGNMEIVPGDGYLGGVIVLSKQTGLVDVPTITDNGVKFSALINPAVMPGRRVQINSEILDMNSEDKMYRVSEATFSGDNRDGDFVVACCGEQIANNKVDEGKK